MSFFVTGKYIFPYIAYEKPSFILHSCVIILLRIYY